MTFPFAISGRIRFDQPHPKITSESYLLHQIEDNLNALGMTSTRISDRELFLRKSDFVSAMRKQDFLRNLKVKVEIDQAAIQIVLTTETILIFIAGLLPYGLFLIPGERLPFLFPFIVSVFFWVFGFVSKFVIVKNIKYNIEHYLKRLNAL